MNCEYDGLSGISAQDAKKEYERALAIGTVLWGNTSHARKKQELEHNLTAYKLAVTGDADALFFLRQRSGRYGIYEAPPGSVFFQRYGARIGGWATQDIKDDAWRYYNSALAIFGMGPEDIESPPPGTPATVPPLSPVDDPTTPGNESAPGDGGGFGLASALPLLVGAGIILAMVRRPRGGTR